MYANPYYLQMVSKLTHQCSLNISTPWSWMYYYSRSKNNSDRWRFFKMTVACAVSQYTLAKKVERIRRIPSHGVAALSAFGIEEGNPFRDCIDSLTIELNQVNTCFTFQQVLYFATIWIGILLLVHSTFFYQSVFLHYLLQKLSWTLMEWHFGQYVACRSWLLCLLQGQVYKGFHSVVLTEGEVLNTYWYKHLLPCSLADK